MKYIDIIVNFDVSLFRHPNFCWGLPPTHTKPARTDGGPKDWTNPHGPIMSLEEHTAEVMMREEWEILGCPVGS